MEKKSSVNDVYQVVKQDFTAVYKELVRTLGEDNPFAKFNIGVGFYLWADTRCQWNQMISATVFEQELVREALFQTKKSVAAKLGEKTTEVLFTVPDDSYIYYNDEGDTIKILIAGWGFKKPVRITGQGDAVEVNKKNPVAVSFSFDGEKVGDFEFGIQLPKQVKRCKTDADGFYRFSNLKVNEQITLKEFGSNRDFMLLVVDGKSEYDFDITSYSMLKLKAVLDNQPVVGESISVAFHGRTYSVVTDGSGAASVMLPLYSGEQITATMREESKSEMISGGGNEILFSFETPRVVVETDVEVSVFADGQALPAAEVTISYAGHTYSGITDDKGVFVQHVEVSEGADCTVSVPDFESQTKPLDSSAVNVFKFEKAKVIPPPVLFTPHILIQGEKGFIGRKYPITVEYEGRVLEFTSDDNGIVPLSEMEGGKFMRVTDGLNPENIAEYELDSSQLEYVFHVPYEPREDAGDIKVTLWDYKKQPIKCDRVRFRQGEDVDILVTLNNEGSAFFGKERFKSDKDITVTVMGSERNFEPITFAIEEGETEYILQEIKPRPWWIILVQILTVVVIAIMLCLLWPVFADFCSRMFDVIYN